LQLLLIWKVRESDVARYVTPWYNRKSLGVIATGNEKEQAFDRGHGRINASKSTTMGNRCPVAHDRR
jgi:hypothetical protein